MSRADGLRAAEPAAERRHLPDRVGGEDLDDGRARPWPRAPGRSGRAGRAGGGSSGSTTSSSVSPAASSWARARCRLLLTAATDVSSISATSAARSRSTSRSTSTARCRGGRCCRAAISASRTLARPATMVAGSSGRRATRPPSRRAPAPARAPRPARPAGRRGRELGAPRPVGSGRRLAAVQRGEAGVGGDPVEPGAQRGPALEAVVGAPGAQVGLLHQVLGVVHRAEHPVAVRQQLAPVLAGHREEVLVGGARRCSSVIVSAVIVGCLLRAGAVWLCRGRRRGRPELIGPRDRVPR